MTATLLASLLFFAAPRAPSTLVRAIDSESEKAVAVVADPRFEEHEPTPVSESSLGKAMTNSGMFSEEDVRDLAGPIATAFGEMEPTQQVRIVYWAGDGSRKLYLIARKGMLRVAYYRGDIEIEHTEARLPKSEAPVAVSTATPSAVATLVAAPTPSPETTRAAKTLVASAAPLTRLTEAEAREQLIALDAARGKGAVVGDDYRRRRKEILNRL